MTSGRQTIADLYETGEEFEEILREALRQTDSDSALDFLAGIEAKWQEYGVRAILSARQDAYLRSLAGVD